MRSGSLAALLRPLQRRVANLLGRGVVLGVDDSGELQRVQVRLASGDLRDGVEVVGHYGLASRPVPGADAVVVFLGGARDTGAVLGLEDRRERPKDLEVGEVRLYSSAGSRIRLRANGDVEIHPGSGGVVKVHADLQVDGSVEAGGDVTAEGDVSDGDGIAPSMREIRFQYDQHVHPQSGGGFTGPPPVPI